MVAYSTAFLPPAPALDVEVRDPQTGVAATILAKIDTGADGSIIPEDLVQTLNLIDFDEIVTVAFNGRLEKQPSYLIDLAVAGRTFTDLEVVAAPIPYLLLGRDVLNQLVTILNGPEQGFEFQ